MSVVARHQAWTDVKGEIDPQDLLTLSGITRVLRWINVSMRALGYIVDAKLFHVGIMWQSEVIDTIPIPGTSLRIVVSC